MKNWKDEENEVWFYIVMTIFYSYWDRLWIVQEFLKEKFFHLCIGDEIIQGEHFQAFIHESRCSGYLYPPS
jgi:hypothetical protein